MASTAQCSEILRMSSADEKKRGTSMGSTCAVQGRGQVDAWRRKQHVRVNTRSQKGRWEARTSTRLNLSTLAASDVSE